MTSRDFAYWLQGYFEINGTRTEPGLTADQAQCIKQHLALVFVHEIDPSAGGAVEQAKLDAIHEGVTKEDMQKAVKEALDKLPRPTYGSHKDVVVRC